MFRQGNMAAKIAQKSMSRKIVQTLFFCFTGMGYARLKTRGLRRSMPPGQKTQKVA